MVNHQKKILEGVKADFLANWENLFRYAIAAGSNENGAKYDIFDSVKTDVTRFGSAVSQAANTFFNTVLGNEIPNDNVLKGRALAELNMIFAQRNKIIAEHVNLNEEDTIALSELSLRATQSLISAFDTSAGEINQDTQNAFKGIFEEVKKLNDNEKLAATELSKRLDEFQQLISSVENVPNFSSKLDGIAHLLSKKPHLLDLFNFSYWEQHVGPSLAETMFVVFMQGMHLVGLISTLDKTVYSNVDKVGDVLADAIGGKETTIGKFAKEATFQVVATGVNGAFSGVADNWANQVAHAKQQARRFITEIGLRTEIFNFAEDFDKRISINSNVTEKFMIFTEQLEAKSGGPLSEELYLEIYKKYAIAKCMSIACAVYGGGESTIGNSPHFTALVGKLKEVITLGGSIKDVITKHPQHLARAALTCVYGTLVGPEIEMSIFSNPFHPNQRNKKLEVAA